MVALLTRRALLIAPHPMPYELLYDQPFINWTMAAPPSEADMGPVLWPASPAAHCTKCGDPAGGGPDPDVAEAARRAGEHAGTPCAVCDDNGRSVVYNNWINVPHAPRWHREQDFGAFFPDVHTIMYSSNRGSSVGMFHNPHHQRELTRLGLRASTAFGCALNYLLFPRPETLALVSEEMRQLLEAPLVIGLQVRVGDTHLDGVDLPEALADRYRSHFNCALALERLLGLPTPSSTLLAPAAGAADPAPAGRDRRPPLQPRWFLISDSLSLRKAAVSWYGNKTIVHLRSRPAHVSTSGTHDLERSRLAVAEHWLFGMTDYQIVHWWSGYGRTAAMRGLKVEMSMWAVREDAPFNCSFAGAESMWEIGEGFSGARRRRGGRRRE